MQEKFLSICIPTFEGATYISDLLRSLKGAFPEFDASVEILISNNNIDSTCTSKTKYEVNKYDHDLPIRFIDNPRKDLRLDGNLLNLINESSGKFLWFICDDDVVTPSAVQQVVSVLKENEGDISVMFINYHEADEELQILKHPIRTPVTSEGNFGCGDDFLRATNLQFGLVSSLVFSREGVMNCELDRYAGKDSLHVPIVLQLAAKNGGYVIKDKLVIMRDNNSRWGASADQIIIISRLFALFGMVHQLQYKKETIKWLQRHFFMAISKTILRCNLRGEYDKFEVLQNLQTLYLNSPFNLTIFKILLYTPRSFVRVIFKLKVIFK